MSQRLTILLFLCGVCGSAHYFSPYSFAEQPAERAATSHQVDSTETRAELVSSDSLDRPPIDASPSDPGIHRSNTFAISEIPHWHQQPRDNSWLKGHLKLVADDADDAQTPAEPDIAQPGPDMGDYPNSAFTLPKGRIYVEFSPLTLQTADRYNSASYNSPFLLRYGITNDVELRLIGSGFASVFDPGNTVSGFTPLIIDTKIHMWDDQMDHYIPAASLEVYVQTTWGSSAFQGGVEPSVNLNLDFPVTQKTNLEMTFGYTGVQDALFVFNGERFIPRFGHKIPLIHRENLNVNQFSYQWAIEHQATEDFQVFIHGYFNGPVFLQSGPGKVIGAGWFYKLSQRAMLFSSYNAGLDKSSPPFSTQLGVAFAL